MSNKKNHLSEKESRVHKSEQTKQHDQGFISPPRDQYEQGKPK